MCIDIAQIHAWAKHWAAEAGVEPETKEYLGHVLDWRQAWRPSQVRILLLAESHVAEMVSDRQVRVVTSGNGAESLPRGFCRLVYCLGYGEDHLCTPTPLRNAGTRQFWDIFGQLAWGMGVLQPRRTECRDSEKRISWKMGTLLGLRDAGVWLQDASVAAFYRPGGERPFDGARYRRMLRESWNEFVWPSVAQEPIEQIWVLGSGVRDALGGLRAPITGYVTQPQDRDASRHRAGVARMVAAVRRQIASEPINRNGNLRRD